MIRWDNTINLGTIVAAVPVLIILIRVIRHMDRVENKVDEMWSWFINNTERRMIIRTRKNDGE